MSNRTKENYREIYKKYHSDVDISGLHIHHLDGDSNNNDISNLIALTQEDHYKIHFFQRDFGAAALLSAGIDAEPPTRPVVKFTLEGYRVDRFNSVQEAGDSVGASMCANISNCCDYNKKSIYGYQWFYESEVGDIDYVGPVKRKSRCGGHKTLPKPQIHVKTLKVFSSQNSAMKFEYPERHPSSCFKESDEFKSVFMEITKEEYKILKQLENE